MTATYDFTVVGGDEASLCAAAAAARLGVRTALIRPAKRKSVSAGSSFPMIPNFVWRRLELHEYGLSVEPVSARVTLFGDSKSVTTHDDVRDTQTALMAAQNENQDHLLWPSFAGDMKMLGGAGAITAAATPAGSNDAAALGPLFRDRRGLAALGLLTNSCASLLDDYFTGDTLKAHIAAHAVGPLGLGGKEPGSSLALTEIFDEDAWRVRKSANGPSVKAVLQSVCLDSGVTFVEGAFHSSPGEEEKWRTITLDNDEKLKSRYLFFASPDMAAAVGMRASLSPLMVRDRATVTIRLSLRAPIEAPAADRHAVFQIIDDESDLQRARDAAADGRLPDKPPVEFEFMADGGIIARTSYCPASFRDENGRRAWTSQDRQAITARIKERLASRLNDLAENIKKTEIDLSGDADPEGDLKIPNSDNIIIQPSRHNAIGAAVRLVDQVLEDD